MIEGFKGREYPHEVHQLTHGGFLVICDDQPWVIREGPRASSTPNVLLASPRAASLQQLADPLTAREDVCAQIRQGPYQAKPTQLGYRPAHCVVRYAVLISHVQLPGQPRTRRQFARLDPGGEVIRDAAPQVLRFAAGRIERRH
jgi:hypothetical protein